MRVARSHSCLSGGLVTVPEPVMHYVVMQYVPYEGGDVLSVHETFERARAHVEEHRGSLDDTIEEWPDGASEASRIWDRDRQHPLNWIERR
jgi:hypothetical protein